MRITGPLASASQIPSDRQQYRSAFPCRVSTMTGSACALRVLPAFLALRDLRMQPRLDDPRLRGP